MNPQADADRLSALLLAKNVSAPSVGIWFNSNAEPNYYITYTLEGQHKNFAYHAPYAEMIARAEALIADIPTGEERARRRFAELLAAAADYGKSKGFDDVLVNPLLEAMERLSKNALR